MDTINTPSKKQTLLVDFLNNPALIKSFNLQQWSLLLRTAAASKLSAHVSALIEKQQLNDYIPEKVKAHFEAAKTLTAYRKRLALWELNRLNRALLSLNCDIIVLKGGAYLLAGLSFADNRHLSDVDILVSKHIIESVEKTLLMQNWQSVKLNDYDQSYYRTWMHEIPPLRHQLRAIEVDIHHTIIPLTSKLQPDPAMLIDAAVPVGSHQNKFKILSPCDMVLHSAVHLFYDSDLSNKLRDLVDMDQLLRFFYEKDKRFLEELLGRGRLLGLQRPLYYALRFSNRILSTPLTENTLASMKIDAPSFLVGWLMDCLVPLALLPEHPDFPRKSVKAARWLLYLRSHFLRMPLKLLLPHLARKSLRYWSNSSN